jgi:hypothetical protein
MKEKKYAVSNFVSGFDTEVTDYSKYEISFRRWVVNQVEAGNLTVQQVAERFHFDKKNFRLIFSDWQLRYSSKIYSILSTMTPEERTQINKLEKRIKELEDLVEKAQIKADIMEIMVDIAERDYKIDIKKKVGQKALEQQKSCIQKNQ